MCGLSNASKKGMRELGTVILPLFMKITVQWHFEVYKSKESYSVFGSIKRKNCIFSVQAITN